MITPVPNLVQQVIDDSILRKAISKDMINFHIINLREFGKGSYRQIDDTPFGGGPGMVLMAEPLFGAIEHSIEILGGLDSKLRILYPSPQGRKWNQETAESFLEVEKLIVICGHYKGVDQRVIEKYISDEYSIGDFVVTNGELPALMMIDSIVRLIPGVLNNIESALSDTFSTSLLDTNYYTQPREIEGLKVPDVLLSGNHKKIDSWRLKNREEKTKKMRPELWANYTKN